MRIDFVSDVACPWCAVGLAALERALERSGIQAELHMQPFELNPTMAAEGANAAQYLKAKYGMSDEQLARQPRAHRRAWRRRGLHLRHTRARVEHVRCAPAAALGGC